jgi:hypothetical protein
VLPHQAYERYKQSHYFTVLLQACDTSVLVTITLPSTEKSEVVVMGKLSGDQITCKLSYTALYIAAVGTAWPPVGSPRNVHAIAIDMTGVMTPSLFGIDLELPMQIGNILLVGVTGRFVGVKLSGSLKMYGSFRVSTVSIMTVIANPKQRL